MQKEVSVSESCKMVGCSRLPGSHGSTAWQTRRNMHEANGHGANVGCISYKTCIWSTGDHLVGYTFEACIFGAVRIRSGVEEVVALVAVVEVVVH